MGVVPPAPGFNAAARALCTRHGALLICDEVMTGFRVTARGLVRARPASAAPDLMTFGKVMGGGFPAAAFGGRADVMAQAGAGRARSTRRARCPGTRSPPPPAWPRCAPAPTTVYARGRRGRARRCASTSPTGARPRTGCRTPCRRGHHVLGLLRRRPGARLRRRQAPGHRRVRRVLPRHARRAASTCRRPRSRRGSSPRPTTTPRSQTIADALPAAARPLPAPRAR